MKLPPIGHFRALIEDEYRRLIRPVQISIEQFQSEVHAGSSFPSPSYDGYAFWRTDEAHQYWWDQSLRRWLGELESGDAGFWGSMGDQYFRDFDSRDMGPDFGIPLPYDVTVVGAVMQWYINRTGNLIVARDGVTMGVIPFSGNFLNVAGLNFNLRSGGNMAFRISGSSGDLGSPRVRIYFRRLGT